MRFCSRDGLVNSGLVACCFITYAEPLSSYRHSLSFTGKDNVMTILAGACFALREAYLHVPIPLQSDTDHAPGVYPCAVVCICVYLVNGSLVRILMSRLAVM